MSESVWVHQSGVGPPGGGPFCVTPLIPTPSLLQLEARSISRSDRCLPAGLVQRESLRQSSMVLSAGSGEQATGSGDPDSSSMASSALVPGTAENVGGRSSSTSGHTVSPSADVQSHSTHEDNATASRVAYLRHKFSINSLSEQASELMLASWRSKSSKSYDSHFRKWASWCDERSCDPVSCPVSEIVNFLAFLHGECYQSRSLNSFRSAISSVHDRVDGIEVGKHPMVARLLKGAFHARPPLPRYTATWDVQIVLQYLEGLGPSTTLSLKLLTYKLVMLLALTRPSRSADLASLYLNRRQYKPEGVVFLPASLAKQSRQGKQLVGFFFPKFPHNCELCPVSTLRCYEQLTEEFRSGESDYVDKLFLSLVKPHRPVTSCTIARWLREVLKCSGVDVNIFSAHSVRGASASAAAGAGVTTNDILKAADWSSESVFQKFYYRPTYDSRYGQAVLSQSQALGGDGGTESD